MFRRQLISTATKNEKLAHTRVKNNEVPVEIRITRFVDSKSMNEIPVFDTSASMECIISNADELLEMPGKVRINSKTGEKEVCYSIKWTPEAQAYVEHNYPLYLEGKYEGDFAPIANYYDASNKSVAKSVWLPVKNQCFLCRVWSGGVPQNATKGSVAVLNASFQAYVYCPERKVFGGSKKDNKDVIQAIAAKTMIDPASMNPMTPSEAAQEATTIVKDSLSPMLRLSMSTSGSVEFSTNNVVCSAFESFSAIQDVTFSSLRLPSWKGDNYAMVLPISDYQTEANSYEELEPGPSAVRVLATVYDPQQLRKAPAKQDPEKTEAREMKKDISMSVIPYEKTCDESCLPWTIFFTLYQAQIMNIGISSLESWNRFGRFNWECIAVVVVDAENTLSVVLNAPNMAAKNNCAGQLNCWARSVFWNTEGTVRKNGIPVGTSLIERLYADIYDDVETKSGRKILCNMDSLGDRLPPSISNPLHTEGRQSSVINLNEWTSDAGWLMTSEEHELFVLPYLPIKPELFKDNNTEAIEEYLSDAMKQLKELSEEDLVNVLLGDKVLDGILTYHKEELDAFKAIQKPEDRALAYPGRGSFAKRSFKGVAKRPSSYDFDFIVWALKKSKVETRVAPKVTTTKSKSKSKK